MRALGPLLLLTWLMIEFWWAVGALTLLWGLVYVLKSMADAAAAQREIAAHLAAIVAARAAAENAAVLAGDDNGVYGQYRPKGFQGSNLKSRPRRPRERPRGTAELDRSSTR
jgi:hypothetical protein